MNFDEEDYEELKCSRCSNWLSYFPIHITANNQHICGRCLSFEDNLEKNEVYEVLAKYQLFPCRYKEQGCDHKLVPKQVICHESQCQFKSTKCPINEFISCDWEGKKSDILKHCHQQHPDLLLKNGQSFLLPSDYPPSKIYLLDYNYLLFLVRQSFVFTEESNVELHLIIYPIEHNSPLAPLLCNVHLKTETSSLSTTSSTTSHQEKKSICLNLNSLKQNGNETKIKAIIYLHESDRSNRLENVFNANVFLRYIKCTICGKYVLPSILQFSENDSANNLCSKCATDGAAKNRFITSIVSVLDYPCINAQLGCAFYAKFEEIKKHQRICLYQKCECLFKNIFCTWTGLSKDLKVHLQIDHPKLYILKSAVITVKLKNYKETEDVTAVPALSGVPSLSFSSYHTLPKTRKSLDDDLLRSPRSSKTSESEGSTSSEEIKMFFGATFFPKKSFNGDVRKLSNSFSEDYKTEETTFASASSKFQEEYTSGSISDDSKVPSIINVPVQSSSGDRKMIDDAELNKNLPKQSSDDSSITRKRKQDKALSFGKREIQEIQAITPESTEVLPLNTSLEQVGSAKETNNSYILDLAPDVCTNSASARSTTTPNSTSSASGRSTTPNSASTRSTTTPNSASTRSTTTPNSASTRSTTTPNSASTRSTTTPNSVSTRSTTTPRSASTRSTTTLNSINFASTRSTTSTLSIPKPFTWRINSDVFSQTPGLNTELLNNTPKFETYNELSNTMNELRLSNKEDQSEFLKKNYYLKTFSNEVFVIAYVETLKKLVWSVQIILPSSEEFQFCLEILDEERRNKIMFQLPCQEYKINSDIRSNPSCSILKEDILTFLKDGKIAFKLDILNTFE